MARVTHDEGVVAACVWDFVGGVNPLGVLWEAARQLDPDVDRRVSARREHARAIWASCSRRRACESVEHGSVSITVEHASFDEWWEPVHARRRSGRRVRRGPRRRGARDSARRVSEASSGRTVHDARASLGGPRRRLVGTRQRETRGRARIGARRAACIAHRRSRSARGRSRPAAAASSSAENIRRCVGSSSGGRPRRNRSRLWTRNAFGTEPTRTPPGAEHAPDLGHERVGKLEVLEQLAGDDCVEALVARTAAALRRSPGRARSRAPAPSRARQRRRRARRPSSPRGSASSARPSGSRGRARASRGRSPPRRTGSARGRRRSRPRHDARDGALRSVRRDRSRRADGAAPE